MNIKPRSHFQPALAFLVIWGLILACGRGAETIQPSGGQPAGGGQAQSGSVLFRDDFQDGQPQEWGITSAWFVEQSGDVYTFGASGRGGAWVTNGGGWRDYTFQTDAYVESGNLLLSINLSKQGRYSLRLGTDGVYLLKEQPAGAYNVIGQAGPITGGTWHRVSLASQAGHLQVWIDQTLWFDTVDAAPIVSQGTIGVAALEGSRVVVDNVLVTRIEGTLPTGTIQAPPPLSSAPSASEIVEEQSSALPSEDVETVEEEPTSPPPETGGQPDLVVSEVTYTPDPVILGQPFTASYVVENRGGGSAGAFTFLLHFHAAAGIADCSIDVDGLVPGQVAWGQCTRTISGDTAGNYPVEATVDIEGEVAESDEQNNLATPTLTVVLMAEDSGGESQAALPDLAITSVLFSPDPVIRGQPFAAHVTVSNNGDADAGIFTVRLHFHPNTGLPDCNWDVPGLGAGGSIRLNCTQTTNAPAKGYRTDLTLDVEGEILESNEDNNTSNQPLTVANP